MSSDSESNSFANLSRISDEHIRRKTRKMLKNLTHKLKSRVDVTWRFDRAIQMPFSTVK